jgi:hypothetical protein
MLNIDLYHAFTSFYPMSILLKMAFFIEKPPVTSSNCYETMKKCFNTDETWLDHNLCNSMLNRKFLVTIATGERLKIAKNHYFALFFSIKSATSQ